MRQLQPFHRRGRLSRRPFLAAKGRAKLQTARRLTVNASSRPAGPEQPAGPANVIPRALIIGAVIVACPALIPAPWLAGGGGNGSSGRGFGGGGGGGFWDQILPLAHADEDDEDDDGDNQTEEDDDEDDDDDDDDEGAGGAGKADTGASEAGDSSKVDDELVDDEDDESAYMEPPKGVDKSAFFCTAVRAEGLPRGEGLPTEEDLFSALNCQPGFWVPQEKVKQDLKQLLALGIFKEVDAKVVRVGKSKSKRMEVRFKFSETFWPEIKSFEVVGSRCLPPDINERVMAQLKKHHDGKPTGLAVLTTIRNVVEGWYGDRGFAYSYMKEFEGLETGHVKVSVCEAKIRSINVKFVDDNFEEKPGGGQTPVSLIKRSISLKPGQFYSLHDGKAALQEAFSLQVFDNAQVQPEFVPQKDDELDITIMLKERPMRTMDVDCEWSLAPTFSWLPLPLPSVVVPGGTLTYEDRNFRGKADTLTVSTMCSSFLHPTDDLSFRLGFRRPFIFGTRTNEDLVVDAFNSRRLSSVFASAPGEDVPPVWVERAGVKISLAETLTRMSKQSFGLVLQEVKTRDDSGALVSQGAKTNPMTGQLAPNGPPTTLSGSGVDRFADLRYNLTRDTTFYVNGGLVGSRDIFDVTQGIGLGNGIFNRYMLSLTRFIKLNTPRSTSTLPPVTLVLHGKTGNTIGPIASYDYAVLGGPHSSRAYSLGELGPARHYLETATELRVPVPVVKKQAYVYAEHAQSLSPGSDLVGNPKEFYNRPGSGTSLGAGVKLGALRVEMARDCNRGTGTWFLHFGERF